MQDDKVAAVAVVIPPEYNYAGATNLHVTVATGPGGKPFMAGKLPYGTGAGMPLDQPITLRGVVMEVPEGDYSLANTNTPTNESTVTHATFVCERWQRLAGIL